jgi:hypothetical protein
MAAMRHSDIGLTMGVYTDPKLLDVAGAVESLPALPLAGGKFWNEAAARATGTDNSLPSEGTSLLAPMLAPTPDNSATPGSIPVRMAGRGDEGERFAPVVELAGKPNKKGRSLGKSDRPSKSGREDLNLRPFGPEPFIRGPRETPLSQNTTLCYCCRLGFASSRELAPRIASKRGSFKCRGVVRGSRPVARAWHRPTAHLNRGEDRNDANHEALRSLLKAGSPRASHREGHGCYPVASRLRDDRRRVAGPSRR